MPPSWVEGIQLTPKQFQMRCPRGKKEMLFKRARLEKYAPYLIRDGLVTRLSVYSDKECKSFIMWDQKGSVERH